MNTLIKDERTITSEQLQGQPHAKVLTLEEIIPFLSSPDSSKPLRLSRDRLDLTDDEYRYPIVDGIPVLYPTNISEGFLGGGLQLKYHEDSKLQYFLLSQIKQHGEINAVSTNVHYQRHLFRMREFLKDCHGTILDVGCDNIEISAALFNEECRYIGLDPFASLNSNFRLIGVGELLPVQDESVDNVVFNTSLDHILDYHQALDEAQRVLKPGGNIYLASLVWTANASLLNDAVHFHHFREYEILGALKDLYIEQISRYQYKDDQHRHGLFIQATKPS